MSLHALLQEALAPTDAEIQRAISGNLCRCGAYLNILNAGRIAAARYAEQQEKSHVHPAH
jgi:aerobic-type carbon monoxide dehydrogenase small subunit (CoxS/CutS family)